MVVGVRVDRGGKGRESTNDSDVEGEDVIQDKVGLTH